MSTGADAPEKVGVARSPARSLLGPVLRCCAQGVGVLGERVDVQPETAAVAPLVDALAEYALSLRESEDGEGK